jgi:hypothetical protein
MRKKRAEKPQTMKEYGEIDFKSVEVRAVDGKFLKWAYHVDHHYERYLIDTGTPGGLFNFDVPVGKLGKLLILDNYGDEVISDGIRKKIMQASTFSQTLGIFHKTGEIVRIAFMKERVKVHGCSEEGEPDSEEDQFSVQFWSFECDGGKPLFLPKSYLKRIDELKSKKRPFYITLPEQSFYAFHDRWASYADLQKSIIIDLHFNGARIQVWGDSYREVTSWRDLNEEGQGAVRP